MFNVIIIGGEKTNNYSLFKEKCIFYLKDKAKSGDGITILSTGDKFVDLFANKYGIVVQYFMPNWKVDGKMALSVRNNKMLNKANAVIAFDDGSKDMEILLSECKNKNIPLRIIKKED